MKIIKTNLKNFNHLKAKVNTYYIDEDNCLIARLSTYDIQEEIMFRKYYTNLGFTINSVYDLVDLKDNSFIIFDYIK